MGFYGSVVVARPASGMLTARPELPLHVGCRWGLPGQFGLHDLGDGWQRVAATDPFLGRYPHLALCARDLVAATGAPALAAYVSESVCVHLEARSPSGLPLSLHLPNTDRPCGYEHDSQPPAVPPPDAVAALGAWATEAGRVPSLERVGSLINRIGQHYDGECLYAEDALLALLAALGFVSRRALPVVVDPADPAFRDMDKRLLPARWKAAAERAGLGTGDPGPEWSAPTAAERDLLAFHDQLWRSVYGGGATRDELVRRYEHIACSLGPVQTRFPRNDGTSGSRSERDSA